MRPRLSSGRTQGEAQDVARLNTRQGGRQYADGGITGYWGKNGCRMCIRAGRPRINYIAGGCLAHPDPVRVKLGDYRCGSLPWAMVARVLVDASRHRLTAGGQRTAALWRMARSVIRRLQPGRRGPGIVQHQYQGCRDRGPGGRCLRACGGHGQQHLEPAAKLRHPAADLSARAAVDDCRHRRVRQRRRPAVHAAGAAVGRDRAESGRSRLRSRLRESPATTARCRRSVMGSCAGVPWQLARPIDWPGPA